MKKLLAILMSLVMLLGMTATAFAASTIMDDDDTNRTADDMIEIPTSGEIEVTAIAKNQDPSEPIVYNVELIWGDMAYAWGMNDSESTVEYIKTWDPTTHTYTDNGDAVLKEGWYLLTDAPLTYGSDGNGGTTGDQSTVLIFNHSNAEVWATAAVEDDTTRNYETKLTPGAVGRTSTTDAAAEIVYDLAAGAEDDDDDGAEIWELKNNAAQFTVKPTKDGDTNNLSETKQTIATLTITLSETDPSVNS